MGCGCGKKKAVVPVDADAPDPNPTPGELSDGWWQAHPAEDRSTVAVPMPQ